MHLSSIVSQDDKPYCFRKSKRRLTNAYDEGGEGDPCEDVLDKVGLAGSDQGGRLPMISGVI